jgi:hypothetical protein
LKLAKLDGSLKQRRNKSPSSQGVARQCPSINRSCGESCKQRIIKIALVVAEKSVNKFFFFG